VAVAATSAHLRCMATGTVKWFNPSKGFGFITPDDKAQPDLFVHHTAISQPEGFRFLVEAEKVRGVAFTGPGDEEMEGRGCDTLSPSHPARAGVV